MDKIKYILWDIDGTLINFKVAEAAALKECYSRFGFGEFTDELLAEYKAINDDYWKQIEEGTIDKRKALVLRFEDFFRIHNIDISIASEFNQAYQMAMGEVVIFNPNAKEAVEACKGKYKQYAASNGTIEAQTRKLAKSGLAELLEDYFISEQVGVEKPAKEFFDQVFKTIGSNDLDEYIIIGDSLTSDIKGGKNAGIKTCWYNPSGKENKSDVVPDYEIKDLIQVIDLFPLRRDERSFE